MSFAVWSTAASLSEPSMEAIDEKPDCRISIKQRKSMISQRACSGSSALLAGLVLGLRAKEAATAGVRLQCSQAQAPSLTAHVSAVS
ncbi:MAG: hypothetical protein EB133_02200, partial [Betaproteobacteria bacterium]|nr:hypothetical protein [Betaproteobacteria bacterium]